MIGGIVQIFDETDPLRSDTTLLAAALVTLGIPRARECRLFHCTYEQVRGATQFRAAWSFRSESIDGRFLTAGMELCWKDGAWLMANPTHPLAILRCGLTFERAFKHTPRFSREYLSSVETPDTWIEAACYNLIFLLRGMPRTVPEGIIRFGPRHAAMVPKNLPESDKTKFIKYVEHPSKRKAA